MQPTVVQIAYQLAHKIAPPGSLASAIGEQLRALWAAIADEAARIYTRLNDLIREAHPLTCDQTLSDWESELGFPDPCVTETLTEDQRRAVVLARLTASGGASRQYFIDVAAAIGIAISISEERPFEVGRDGMGDPIGGAASSFNWVVNAPASTSAALAEIMECTFIKIKPSRTEVTFIYS